MKGSISCQCGEVRLEIGDASPIMRLQCGCCDCRQAMAWAQRQGGPKVPSTRPLDLWYFENDILVSSGKENLKWYKLRKNGKVSDWPHYHLFKVFIQIIRKRCLYVQYLKPKLTF